MSRPRVLAGVLGAALAAGWLLPSGRAQADPLPEGPQAAHDTIRVPSNPLEAASLVFAGALADLSGDRMLGILASGGIRLQLEGVGHTGLSSRQAAASLRDFLRGYEGGDALVTRAAPVEGSPDRGFAEILWWARASGTSQEVRRTLFLGLSRDSGQWRVDEVRVLR